jgi:hypothetical protein
LRRCESEVLRDFEFVRSIWREHSKPRDSMVMEKGGKTCLPAPQRRNETTQEDRGNVAELRSIVTWMERIERGRVFVNN